MPFPRNVAGRRFAALQAASLAWKVAALVLFLLLVGYLAGGR